MAAYEFQPKALRDTQNIWDYTVDAWSEEQADKYHRMLHSACQQIADNPDPGKHYDGVARNLRGYRAGRHIIFFLPVSVDKVLIVRILHGQMDLRNRIRE